MSTQISRDLNDHLVADARRLFASTLASWAQDLLTARRQGLLSMQWQQDENDVEFEERWSIAA